MTILEVKNKLNDYIGESVTIKYNLGRNKSEKYDAIITELFDYIFLVNNNGMIKSFSYSDIITKTIKIYFS